MNTHFDESMKYITSAPMLRAKTKTTCKRREKCHHLRAERWDVYLFILWNTHPRPGNMVLSGACWQCPPLAAPTDTPLLLAPHITVDSNLAAGQQRSGQTSVSPGTRFDLALLSQSPTSPQLKSTDFSRKRAGKNKCSDTIFPIICNLGPKGTQR